MSDAGDYKWVGRFHKRYIATIGPHDWPDDPDDMRFFAEGWVGAFLLAHPPITEAVPFAPASPRRRPDLGRVEPAVPIPNWEESIEAGEVTTQP